MTQPYVPSTIYIRRIQSVEEYQALQQVQRRVWGFGPHDTVMHLPLMVALQKYGGLILGAFHRLPGNSEELIGFVLGFLGRDEQTGQYFHYSQIAAALAEWQSQGIGYLLKTAQRREIITQGYTLMRWAFDPLEGRNAYFNIAKLGGISRSYFVNMYGPGRGELFGQLDTDRLIIDWQLDSPRVEQRLQLADTGHKPPLPLEEYMAAPPLVEVEWLAENLPAARALDLHRAEPRLRLEIPYQNRLIQKHDYAQAENWRNQTRALFTHYLGAGYHVADFFTIPGDFGPRAFYLLQQ